jgi:hypothetical protein
MNNMAKETRHILLLCATQILCVLGWYGLAVVYYLYTKQYLISKPYLVFISPPLVAAAASFVLSILFPIKSDLKNAIGLSLPATLIYFIFYILKGYFNFKFNTEAIPLFCVALVPITILMSLVNGSAVWFGSLIRKRISRQKDGLTGS